MTQKTKSGLIKLTTAGIGLANAVNDDTTVLLTEKLFLEQLPKSISQRQISELLEWT